LELNRKGSFVEDLSEKEQLDAMRDWWSENGNYVIGGILAGVILIFGINQWRTSTADAQVAASTLYEDVMFGAGSGDLDATVAAATLLFSEYNESPYAAQSRLALARLYMDNARDQDAVEVLTTLIDTNPDQEIALVARLRLAKILLYQGKAEEVVGLIGNQADSAFSSRFREVLGDAHVELEQFVEAEVAYMAALGDASQAQTMDTALIQLKINDLPEMGGAAAGDELIEDAEAADATADAAENAAADEPAADEVAAEPEAEPDSGNE
jgi:predicted negative regulator of RcsB-dependent stress response